ncbi:MAG: DNA polymerase Y family protein [Gammaproteobacteria bacterium]|nr:DNA polymerase Y family protein [Gammaproteobacteria bacterium]
MLWTAIYLPQLGLEVFRPAQTLAFSRAVVLVEEQRIVLANKEAVQAGIQVGSNLATAHSIVSELEYHIRDQRAEEQRLQDLVVAAYLFSPAVSVALPSTLLLEVEGSLALFNGLPNLARQLTLRIRQRGHVAQLGIAHTPLAALALAKAHLKHVWPDFPPADKVQEVSLRLLHQVPLACAELKFSAIERMSNMGIRSLGELIDLPHHELGARFNAELMNYIGRLTGTIPDVWPWEEPTEPFVVERHLLEPIRDKGTLLQPMTHLVQELNSWLNSKYLGVKSLRWWFATFERTGVYMPLSFAEPHCEVDEILALTELKYDDIELPEDVMTIRLEVLHAESLAQHSQRQSDLFGARQRQVNASTELIDRLAIKLGEESLKSLSQLDDHRPEFAWSPAFPTESERSATRTRIPGKRPLWLLEPPQRVQLKHFEVLTQQERIEGGWWEQPLSRDYFVARHESGTICWLFQDVTGWYQHGYFA